METRDTPSYDPEDDSVSLQQLDPSPVHEPIGLSGDSYFPPYDKARPPLGRASSSILGLHGHSTIYYLSRIQRYASYASTLFLTFHIANNSLIPLITRSVPASEPYLLLTRPFYQSPLAEPLVVLLPFVAHISAGLALRLYRRAQHVRRHGADSRADRRRLAWPKFSGTSALGYLLLPFFLGHAFINRILPLWFEGGSSSIGLSYVSHGFARYPALSFVGYTALIGLASWHFVWGGAKWLAWTPHQVPDVGVQGSWKRKWRWYTLNGLSALLTALWMSGGLGIVGRGGPVRGWLGKVYDNLFRRIPIMGRWI